MNYLICQKKWGTITICNKKIDFVDENVDAGGIEFSKHEKNYRKIMKYKKNQICPPESIRHNPKKADRSYEIRHLHCGILLTGYKKPTDPRHYIDEECLRSPAVSSMR